MSVDGSSQAEVPGRLLRPLVTPSQAKPSRSWQELTSALLVLAITGASVVLAANQFVIGPDRAVAFLLKNELAPNARRWLVPLVLAGAVLPPTLAALLLAVRGRGIGDSIWRVAWLTSPLALAWAIPSLLAYGVWYEKPTPYLVYLAACVLAAEPLLRRFFVALEEIGFVGGTLAVVRPDAASTWRPLAVVVCAAAAYAAYTGYYSILQHWRFRTGGYDLGIYDNLIFNNMHGRLFQCPILRPGLNYLSNHAEFGTLLIVPIYALKPGPELLLVLQSVFIGFAAVPLYFFASTQLSRPAAALVALCYLLFAPVHGPNFYDFHWVPMAMPLWFTLFYALALRKRRLVFVMVALLLPIREEVGVMLAVLGLFLIVTDYWQRVGAAFFALGVVWFAAMRFVVMPLAGSWWFDNMYADLIPPGDQGFGGVVRTLLTNPNFVWKTLATEAKLTYALHLFAPLAFLPLRRPALVLLAVPGAFFTLLTTNYPHTLSIRFQYTAHWVPWLFAASILMLKTYREGERGLANCRGALAALVFGVLCHSYVFGAVLQRDVFVAGFHRVEFTPLSDRERARLAVLDRMRRQIPKDASVAATDAESAHIATRLHAYTLRITHGDAEYLLLRGRSLPGNDRKVALDAFNRAPYGLLDSGEDLYLFKKHHVSDKTAAALRTLNLRPKNAPKPAKP